MHCSLLEDINADVGFIITNNGCSKAAENFAKAKKIRLLIMTMDEFEEMEIDFYDCQICQLFENEFRGTINFIYDGNAVVDNNGMIYQFETGTCNRCNGLHIKCQSCGIVTAIWEGDYNRPVECEGGCGLTFEASANPKDACIDLNVWHNSKPTDVSFFTA